MCASLILGTANHLGKKQIGEIWNDNADRVSALKFQAPRQAMRLVIQRFQGPLYSLREHLAHGTLFVDEFSQKREPEHLEVFAPGADPVILKPGQARLIKAGSYIVFEIHYTPNGQAQSDRTSVGLIFAKQPPQERVRTIRIQNGVKIAIPPGEENYRVESRVSLLKDLKIVSFMPHMHLRGKAMEFRAIYPSGESEVLLSVPHYDFHWQMSYILSTPKALPKGTILVCIAAWDNSANNPNNPNPKVEVVGGLQSEEEMMAGFVELGIDPQSDSLDFFTDAPVPTQSEKLQSLK